MQKKKPRGPYAITESTIDALDPAMQTLLAMTYAGVHARMAKQKPDGGGFADELARSNTFAPGGSAVVLAREFLLMLDGKFLPAYMLARMVYVLTERAVKSPSHEASGDRLVVLGLAGICEQTGTTLSRARYASRVLAQRHLITLQRPVRAGYGQLTAIVHTHRVAPLLYGARARIDEMRAALDDETKYEHKLDALEAALAEPIKPKIGKPFE